jgi:hypothetical protein
MHESGHPPNKRFQLTPLRGSKIVGILQSDFGSTAFPIYSAAQLKRNPLGVCQCCCRVDTLLSLTRASSGLYDCRRLEHDHGPQGDLSCVRTIQSLNLQSHQQWERLSRVRSDASV